MSVDWRGHGESPGPGLDFGTEELIEDAIELIDNLQLDQVVPVALSHAGWVALELRRKLGAERIPAVVLLDWMPLALRLALLRRCKRCKTRTSGRRRELSCSACGVPGSTVPTYSSTSSR